MSFSGMRVGIKSVREQKSASSRFAAGTTAGIHGINGRNSGAFTTSGSEKGRRRESFRSPTGLSLMCLLMHSFRNLELAPLYFASRRLTVERDGTHE
jgi:hypothetical protein